jgi:tetratricopeptide (TPR) repeat protein
MRKVEYMDDQSMLEPNIVPQPKTAAEFQLRGYAFYAKGDYPAALVDFQQAIALDPADVEAVYALGLTYKVQGRLDEGINAFQRALDMIDSGVIADATRAKMLGRLARGHLNKMTIGDWNLEKEIWKRSE